MNSVDHTRLGPPLDLPPAAVPPAWHGVGGRLDPDTRARRGTVYRSRSVTSVTRRLLTAVFLTAALLIVAGFGFLLTAVGM